MEESKFWFGKKFVKKDGEWVECKGTALRNRFGVPTTLIRVPTAMMPVLTLFLDKLAEVETVRRNLSTSVRNTSPEFFVDDVRAFFGQEVNRE